MGELSGGPDRLATGPTVHWATNAPLPPRSPSLQPRQHLPEGHHADTPAQGQTGQTWVEGFLMRRNLPCLDQAPAQTAGFWAITNMMSYRFTRTHRLANGRRSTLRATRSPNT